MEEAMKNRIPRILISASLFSLSAAIVVAIAGLILGWKSATQFSDGFFWAGAIMISIGFVNLLGMFSQRTGFELRNSPAAVHLDMVERSKIWQADILHGYDLLAFLGISGLLLFGLAGLAILVGRLF
jgi:hypothetical protein